MPMLYTIGSGKGSCRQLAEYLVAGGKDDASHEERLQMYLAGDARASRALAFGHSDNLDCDQLSWHQAMRATRKFWDKEAPPPNYPKNKRWRNYYHWAISPDPNDHVSAEEVGALSRKWLEQMWPSEDGWEWVYSVHADNEGGIMHSHAVLNAVNANTGRKAHIDRRETDSLADGLQEIAAGFGMGQLPKLAEWRHALRTGDLMTEPSSKRVSAAEKALRARGKRSWVAEIRDEIDRAIKYSGDFDSFKAWLEHDGFKVERSRRGLGFRHPESTGHDKKVLASSLGSDYTDEGIRARISFAFDEHLLDGSDANHTEARRDSIAVRASKGKAPLKDRRPQRLADRLTEMVRLGPRRNCAQISGVIDAISTVKNEGYSSVGELEAGVALANEQVLNLEREISLIEDGFSAASRALRAATELRDAKWKLESLPKGFWDKNTRMRRNELVETISEQEDLVRRSLEKASRFLDSRGLSEAPWIDQASELVSEIGKRSDGVRERAAKARDRLEALTRAENAFSAAAGRTVMPERRRGTKRLVYLGGPSTRQRRVVEMPSALVMATQRQAVRSIERLLSIDHAVSFDIPAANNHAVRQPRNGAVMHSGNGSSLQQRKSVTGQRPGMPPDAPHAV